MEIRQEEFREITNFIRGSYGINLTEKKTAFIVGRLSSLIEKKGFGSFSEYYDHLRSDKSGSAITEFLDRITTNHTYFYREEKHFEFFQEKILPEIRKRESMAKDIRIWSAGCSSGEEPYTLSFIIDEFLGSEGHLWDSTILATDISQSVLQTGQEGIYKASTLENMPFGWTDKYFDKISTVDSKVKDKIRKNVIFRKFNLMEDFPFKKKFHLILCRNVMIYFNDETKANLIDKFYDALEPGGYLFIGHSETIDRKRSKFRYIQPAIYKKD